MGGAAKTAANSVAQVVKVGAAPIYAPVLAAKNVIQGDNVGTAIGKSIQPAVKSATSLIGGVVGGATGGPAPAAALPTPPPEVSADEKAKAAEEARRKTKAEMTKDTPGRAATQLTGDSAFPYRLV